jgi:hypothetical protein
VPPVTASCFRGGGEFSQAKVTCPLGSWMVPMQLASRPASNGDRGRGQQQVVAAVELADPLQALRPTFKLGCRFWASEHSLVRRLSGLAAVDPEIRQALSQAEQQRLPLLTRLVERLADAGYLAAGCSTSRAVDLLWLLSSFEAFDQLFTGRQLPAEKVASMLFDLAAGSLTQPASPPAT